MVEYIIPKIFIETVAKNRTKVALRFKKDGTYQDITYDQFKENSYFMALGLIKLGIKYQDRVAILSQNRPEWAFADIAILWLGGINVPIYDTLTSTVVSYILNNSGAKVIFVDNQTQLEKILAARSGLLSLTNIIVFDEIPDEKRNDFVLSLPELIAIGRKAAQELSDVLQKNLERLTPDTVCSLVYTSGTTGQPKGVMLTHGNFISNVVDTLKVVPINGNDTVLSFLPLSHVLERTGGYYTMIVMGGTIAYAVGIDTVAENMGEVRPTFMVSVPRLYEKMYARILEKVEHDSGLKQKIFHWGTSIGAQMLKLKTEKREIPLLLNLQFKIADKLVFSKLKNRTGGRLRFFVSGGAPLAKHIGVFFAAADIIILEGYGLTESSPVITCNRLDAFKFGTVGIPIPGAKVRIDDDGEILAFGPNIMKGYYSDEGATKESLTEIDGEVWLRTGDIGYLDEDGFLTITDRKKEMIIMSNGKNVAPQPIENLLKMSKYISQAILIGDNRKFMVALIAPDFDQIQQVARDADVAFDNPAELVKKPEIIKLFDDEVGKLMSELPRFEQIKKYHLIAREFSQVEGELTPTLKPRRKIISEHFAAEIEKLYS